MDAGILEDPNKKFVGVLERRGENLDEPPRRHQNYSKSEICSVGMIFYITISIYGEEEDPNKFLLGSSREEFLIFWNIAKFSAIFQIWFWDN